MTKAAFEVTITPDIPEHVVIEFMTSDLCGGDSGHGAWATLTFTVEGGAHQARIVPTNDEAYDTDDPLYIRIVAFGDWEITGLAEGLVALGDKLRPLVEKRQKIRQEFQDRFEV